MAEGRDIRGTVGRDTSKIPWWQKGSTQAKPTYFKKNVAQQFWRKQQPAIRKAERYFDNQQALIKDRNDFYSSYNADASEPKYSFADAMKLSQYGYTGLFGRSQDKDKRTLGLLGEEWQRAYALDRLRNNKKMLGYSIMANAPEQVLKDTAAATIISPGTKQYNNLANLYVGFNDKYGANGEKYADRWGHLPEVGSKYGILFNTDNKKIRNDDVNATYQNNLAAASVRAGKALTELGEKTNNDALKALGLQYAGYGEYKLETSRSKYNKDHVEEMKTALQDVTTMSGDVAKALGGAEANAFSRVATGYLGFLASGTPLGVAATQFGPGKDLAEKALDYMNGLSDSDFLKAKPIYWKSMSKGGISQFGLFGLQGNLLRGVARMGLGLPAGLALATDEAYLAGKETAKWATKDDYSWGQDVDFKLGDAVWADYANRYYDPFAYDEKGQKRGFFEGLSDPAAYDRLGEKIGNDPSAYILDALDVAPMVGFSAKAAGLAAIGARTGRMFGKVGLTAADETALKAARTRVMDAGVTEYTAEQVKDAQGLIDTLNDKPHLIDTVDQGVLEEAAKIVSDQATREELAVIQTKFDQAPSARTFRRTARAAYNGDELAQDELSRWRAMGYEFNGAERSWGVKAGALFEPRTKVLDKPESVLNASDDAVIRLPASPIMRGAKEAFYWVGRGIDRATIAASEKTGVPGTVGTKLLDMPLFSYRYNYTKAIKNTQANLWGDINTEMQRAAKITVINNEAEFNAPMARAIEAQTMGGEGAKPLQYPAIQRQQIQDKIAELPRDKKTGEVLAVARKDLINLERQLSDLLDTQIADIREAAAAFDEAFDQNLTDIRMRLADASYKADDKMLDKAVDMVRRIDRQDQAVRSRIVHEDITPTSIEHLKLLYTEAMDGLRLSAVHLFGKNGKTGRVGRWTGKVLRVNTNMLMRSLAEGQDRATILAMAQRAEGEGTIFDDIADPALRKQREDEMVQAFAALGRNGMFIDGMGSYGTPGRPVLVKADVNVGKDFVAFHIPTLRHEFANGKVYNSKVIDKNEVFVLPKVFFSARKKGAGAPIVENATKGRQLLYEGSLNAMSNVYPRARFYSEKLNDTGLRGVRQNEQMIANEHQVALTGMRQHALSRIVQSQVYYLRNRVERDLRGLAEGQAVLVPASQVVGKTASESGYHVLKNVGVFDSVEDALDFARLRGVGKEAEDTLMAYADGTLKPIEKTFDLTEGLGVRIVDGRPQFIVRGGTHDWLNEAIQEDITQHSTMDVWYAREFSDPTEIPRDGMVLAVPDQTFKDLAEMTIEADNLSARLLNSGGVKAFGNVFKWFVLNANPAFISNNIIGGMAMMLMMNPAASGRLMATMIEKMARESIRRGVNNDWFTHQLTHFKKESEAVSRQLAYEFENNIYKQDAGIAGAVEGVPWYKKYVWHGGYTVVSAWEEMMRRNVAMQFLRSDPGFQSFMRGPEVKAYIEAGQDWNGVIRQGDEAITPFEAAVDLLLDPSSDFFNPKLKHRMRYTTNTVSGNYHRFTPAEQLMRNVVMPFYAWQRHSATFSYRMLVDKPITTNVLYNLGQQGYLQNAEQGVPDWMMQTIPPPQFIKDAFGITDEDFRLDGGMLSPFGTTGDMGMAAFSLLTGAKSYSNVFEFTNPYMNQLIQDTLGVNPQTGAIDWNRLKKDGTNASGIFGMGKDMFTNVYKATYPAKLTELAKYQEYQDDALNNKYSAVENAPDILKNYDPTNPEDPWKLSIPEQRMVENRDLTQRFFNAIGIRSYRMNPESIPMSGRRDAVGAIVMKYINDNENASKAEKAANSATEWKRRYDYVMQVWLPAAQAQGMDPAQIQFVIAKIRDERPKTGIAKQLANMIGG